MDGHFVPNLTMGPVIVEAIRRSTRLPLDVHLMITDPDRYLQAFFDAGASRLAVHVEVLPHLHRTIHAIKKLGMRGGRRNQPGHAGRGARGDRRGSRPRAGDVGEPGVLGSDFHPAQ